jgi:hypothetical protein
MPGKLPGNSGTDSIKTQVRDSFAGSYRSKDRGLRFRSLSSIGQFADLTEVTWQCLLWPEPEAGARVGL